MRTAVAFKYHTLNRHGTLCHLPRILEWELVRLTLPSSYPKLTLKVSYSIIP